MIVRRGASTPPARLPPLLHRRQLLEATRRDSLFPFLYAGYDVMPNGREFLMLKAAASDQGAGAASSLTITTNWPQLLAPSRGGQPGSVP